MSNYQLIKEIGIHLGIPLAALLLLSVVTLFGWMALDAWWKDRMRWREVDKRVQRRLPGEDKC